MTATQKAAEAVAEPVRQETGPLVLAYVADGSLYHNAPFPSLKAGIEWARGYFGLAGRSGPWVEAWLARDRLAFRPQRWDEREAYRLRMGGYQQPVWHRELFWRGSLSDQGPALTHYAHVSLKDPTMIAFTADADKGERDIQTAMKPGKYLKKFFGDVLTDKQIAFYSEWWRSGVRPPNPTLNELKLRFARSAADIVHVYCNGPNSCMSGSDAHTTAAYAAGDLALAYMVTPDGQIVARALTWPKKKALGRIYASDYGSVDSDDVSNHLKNTFKAKGYTSYYEKSDVFNGARLLSLIDGYGNQIVPYIDRVGAYGPVHSYSVLADDYSAYANKLEPTKPPTLARLNAARAAAGLLPRNIPMKFSELKFSDRPLHPMGEQATAFFPNGYGVSVIRGPHSYGGRRGLYELAVLRGNDRKFDLTYSTPLTDDVLGNLTPEDVTRLLSEVEALPPA